MKIGQYLAKIQTRV